MWRTSPREEYEIFISGAPTLEDHEAQLRRLAELEAGMEGIPAETTLEALCLNCAPLKQALRAEAAGWKAQYASRLHAKAATELQASACAWRGRLTCNGVGWGGGCS